MHALDKKLVRDFKRLWAQSLAIALVLACGVMILVIAISIERSLTETQQTFYERNRFADVFATTTRAPNTLKAEIEQISGISIVDLRISQYAILDIEGMIEPATAQILSLPKSGEPLLNTPLLRSGSLPSPLVPDEVAVSENFALANDFKTGDSFFATLNGQKRKLMISGTVLSPEFIYLIGPGAMMPDNQRFGVIWMGYDALATAFDLQGAFNNVSVKLTLDANELKVVDELSTLLGPYGGTEPYTRALQISHMFLESELDGLRVMGQFLPPLFFVISAFLVNMVLGRLILLEREQIGLLKAVGYSSAQISWHYVKLALGIAVAGILAGWIFGVWSGYGMSSIYSEYFYFPYLIYITNPDTYAISGLAGLATAVAGALQSVLKVTRLSPAVAMSPPAPIRFRKNVFDRIGHFFRARQPLMMIIRSISRWPVRALLTVLGISMSGAIMVASLFMFDAVDVLIDSAFFQTNRQDATLSLVGSKPRSVLAEVENLPGVLSAEGVRTIAVRLNNGHLNRAVGVEGREPDTDLSRVLDPDSNVVVFPEHGIVLSEQLAKKLDANVGDILVMEVLQGQRNTFNVPVTGIITQYFGIGAYMNMEFLSNLLQQNVMMNTIHVAVDDNLTDELYESVKQAPAVAGIVMWENIRASFDEEIAKNQLTYTFVLAMVGSLIVVGVVYNSARIQLSERARELASLRILGFTRAEVSFILMGEMMFLTLLAIPVGSLIGTFFAWSMITGFSSEIYTIPFVITRGTIGFAAIIVFGASLASSLLVRRRINNLDLVAVMKTRE